jgi:GTP-binding protein
MSRFVDEVTITVKSGKGGDGAVSFRREKFVPKGGPDGGDGGSGGNVLIHVRREIRTLYHLTTRNTVRAKNGMPGESRNKSGAHGKNAIIDVPAGTVVIDALSKRRMADLTKEGETLVAVEGGRGGLGNSHFATSTNRAPRYAQKGIPGREAALTLQMKIIADVGIIGLPNAGKSTLLSVLTNAKPRIADYPFTTLYPNLGVLQNADHKEFIIADLPGLIEGASSGQGLGIRFLKHIERTRVLLFLLDLLQENFLHHYQILEHELIQYSEDLTKKPMLIVGSKRDVARDEQVEKLLSAGIEGKKLVVSSIDGCGIEKLKSEIADMMGSIDGY